MNFADIGLSLVKVLVVGITLGAGLPVIFALGLKGLARTEARPDGTLAVTAAGRTMAGVAFAVVAIAVIAGIVWIVSGGH
ncbi:hypothetical protein ACTVCO_09655 [Sanguibacter sp. A247]|uniref:hypothetical protein n=1 Tax=unclassified Sanguibacter TaxID=2645534 RepID=UPI003FD89FC9